MKLPRVGDSIEDRVIEEAATKALTTGEKIIDLKSLKAAQGQDVRQLGLSLQKKGFGQLLEISGGGDRDYHLSMRDIGFVHAAEVREALRRRTFTGRLRSINWVALNAVAALIAALAALAAAYFSYLSLMSSHAAPH